MPPVKGSSSRYLNFWGCRAKSNYDIKFKLSTWPIYHSTLGWARLNPPSCLSVHYVRIQYSTLCGEPGSAPRTRSSRSTPMTLKSSPSPTRRTLTPNRLLVRHSVISVVSVSIYIWCILGTYFDMYVNVLNLPDTTYIPILLNIFNFNFIF